MCRVPSLAWLRLKQLFCLDCRSSLSGRETKRILPVMRKDQTTSTCDEEVFEVYSRDVSRPQDGLNRFLKEHGDNRHKSSVGGSVIANPNAVAVGTELDLNTEPNDVACLYKTAEQMRVQASLAENLFFYNQPVAILHAPAFFHLEEQEEQPQWAKSATLPRAGASNSAASESLSKDSFTQTLPKGPPLTQNQEVETDDQLGVLGASRGAASTSTSRAHFNLPELSLIHI